MPTCTHLDLARDVILQTDRCEECLKTGDEWIHLRMCLSCGHVGCCDSSKNKHATNHYHLSHHPLVQSIEAGAAWVWCYVDQVMFQPA
jgi:uncharacterized UBP type Zn finger protein